MGYHLKGFGFRQKEADAWQKQLVKIDFFISGTASGYFLYYFDLALDFLNQDYTMPHLPAKGFIFSLVKKSLLLLLSFLSNEIAIAQGTPSQGILLQTADSLYQSQQWKPAKEKYLQWLKDSANKPMQWHRLGYCNHQLGLYNEAIINYRKALALNPGPQLKYSIEAKLARSYGQLKNEKEATEWLGKASQSGYQDINEINRINDFDVVRSTPAFKELYKKIYTNAYPCSADPTLKEFDFWIGEWDVFQNGSNLKVGNSLVQKVSGECALLENWDAVVSTNTGKSLNYYDAAAKSWVQDWIGSIGGSQRYINGVYKDSAMRFTYENITEGKKTNGNFIFYNMGPDKVRQYQNASEDGGKTFTVSYDYIYIRKK